MGSSPKAPDYAAAAQQQGAADLAVTQAQTAANRPTQVTPWGKSTWTPGQTIDPATGKPVTTWTGETTLNPEQQAALTAQQGIQAGRSGAAAGLMDQLNASYSKPFDFGQLKPGGERANLPTGPGQGTMAFGLGGDPNAWRNQAQESVWQFQKPALDEAREAREASLQNQGITDPNSRAFQTSMRAQSDEEARARLQAMEAGRAESQLAFGQNQAAKTFQNLAQQQEYDQMMGRGEFGIKAGAYNEMLRGNQLQELLQQRGMPLQDINDLLAGQGVGMPDFGGYTAAGKTEAPDILGSTIRDYESRLGASNARNAQNTGIASAAMMAAAVF